MVRNKEKLDKVRRVGRGVGLPEENINYKDEDTFDVAGVFEMLVEEANDEETIKKRLRAMGYLG